MPCKYAFLLPLWIAFFVHQVVFSPYFQGLRARARKCWDSILMKFKFRGRLTFLGSFFHKTNHPSISPQNMNSQQSPLADMAS